MSRIEELPDGFDESINLNEAPGLNVEEDAPLKELYSSSTPRKGAEKPGANEKSFEEVMQELSQTPLFMNNLDDAMGADGENVDLDAIRALQYEGTKVEIAQGFKEQGNEMVKVEMWSDAKEFYTKAIAVLTDKSADKWEGGEALAADAEMQQQLEEHCYSNRALCHLKLKNYRSTTLDCAAALRLNHKNIKAHYRSASALLALNKIVEASDVCSRGLKLDPSNIGLTKLNDTIRSRRKIADVNAEKRVVEEYRKERKKLMLATALKTRKIKLRGSTKPPDLEDAEIHLSPDFMDAEGMLVFPVVFLYPMHAQSDFVKQFNEKDAIIDHLSYLFPLPWDAKQQYDVSSVACYMDTVLGGMAKIGKKLSLLQALTTGNIVIVDGLVRIYIVPTSMTDEWIGEMKRRKKGG